MAIVCVQTHRTQLASGNPSGRAEWNFRCCFALELPNVYDDIKVILYIDSLDIRVQQLPKQK